jgi:hypothetical protein
LATLDSAAVTLSELDSLRMGRKERKGFLTEGSWLRASSLQREEERKKSPINFGYRIPCMAKQCKKRRRWIEKSLMLPYLAAQGMLEI